MRKRNLLWAGFGASVLMTVLAGTGCGHDAGPVPPAARQTAQQNMGARIQDVQNNPGIPPEDKARMIAAMQSQMGAVGTKR